MAKDNASNEVQATTPHLQGLCFWRSEVGLQVCLSLSISLYSIQLQERGDVKRATRSGGVVVQAPSPCDNPSGRTKKK